MKNETNHKKKSGKKTEKTIWTAKGLEEMFNKNVREAYGHGVYLDLFLMRHGTTVENEQNIIQGTLDGKLTDEAKSTSCEMGRKFRGHGLDLVLTSEMGRARESLKYFLKGYGSKVPMQIEPLLNERYWGVYQGKKIDDTPLYTLMHNEDPSKQLSGKSLFNIDPDVAPFNGLEGIETIETQKEFRARAQKFIDKYLTNRSEENILCMGHDWMYSAILNLFLMEKPRLVPLHNNSYHRISSGYADIIGGVACKNGKAENRLICMEPEDRFIENPPRSSLDNFKKFSLVCDVDEAPPHHRDMFYMPPLI